MLPALAHIDTWIFDLDNTLYPSSADLFGHIDRRMGEYIGRRFGLALEEARALQKSYFHAHGTTLKGLMDSHGTDPHDFLAYVHDIPMDALAEDRRTAAALARLPGRKLVFTNGDRPYAEKVLARLGLGDSFEDVHDIHAMGYWPKPDERAYRSLLDRLAIDPARALFAEDMAQNLRPAKALGMTTLWIDNGSERGNHALDDRAIDFRAPEIGAWLEEVLAA